MSPEPTTTGAAPASTPAGPPPPSDHDRTTRVVSTVVALVLVAALIGGLLGGGKRDDRLPDIDESSVISTPPTTVAPPTTVELPGPQPGQPRGSGPGKAIHLATQVDPPTTEGLEVDEEPTTTPDPSDQDQEQEADPRLPAGSGQTFEVYNGHTIEIPEGYDDGGDDAGDGHHVLGGDGAVLTVASYTLDGGATEVDAMEAETRYIGDAWAELRVGDIHPQAITGAQLVSVGSRRFQGILPGLNGSVAVDGLMFGFALEDDTAFVLRITTRAGELPDHAPDLAFIVDSFLKGLEAEAGS